MAEGSEQRELDQALVGECLRGNRHAQESLFNRFRQRMMAVCIRYMGDPDRAADVFQDGFIRVFRLLGDWRAEGPLEAWIRKVMVSTALNELRRRKLISLEENSDGFVLHPLFNTAISHLAEKDLLAMVASLPKGYRTVFNLYAMEGYSHREIADLLGISENTSRTQLLKARVQLQKMILTHESGVVRPVVSVSS